MAQRRMIHRDVICSDDFITMSFEAQAVFFQLQIEGDDFGFVSSPKKVLRSICAEEHALEELISAGFLYRFQSGVVVLRHWDVCNTRKNDRPHATAFQHELSMIRKNENGIYEMLDSG